MGKVNPKKLPEFYLRVAKTLQEASVKLGLRSALGYVQGASERNMLLDIQEIFFPGQEPPEDTPQEALVRASSMLMDAWAGLPVPNLPSIAKLQTAEYLARQLRALPLHS